MNNNKSNVERLLDEAQILAENYVKRRRLNEESVKTDSVVISEEGFEHKSLLANTKESNTLCFYVRPYIDYSFVEDGSKEVFTTVASHHDEVKEMRKELTEFYTLIAETNTQLAETKSKLAETNTQLAKTINQVQFLEESERKKKAAIHEACKTLLQVTQTLLDQTL